MVEKGQEVQRVVKRPVLVESRKKVKRGRLLCWFDHVGGFRMVKDDVLDADFSFVYCRVY